MTLAGNVSMRSQPIESAANTREEILRQLDRSEKAATDLVAGLSNVQANWRSGPASWSIWQCLDHLARINRVYSGALLEAVQKAPKRSAATQLIAPGWFGRWFISLTEPPARTRMKAPRKVVPAAEGEISVALQDFVESHRETRDVAAEWETTDLNRLRFRNPFIPLLRFTVGTGLLIINAHDRRHLCQAQTIIDSVGFPPA